MQTARKQRDDEDLPPDLVALRRRLAAHGVSVRLPRPGAVWVEPEPIELPEGVSLSDIIVRLRHAE